MAIQVIEVMSADDAKRWRERVEALDFVDGRGSARGLARLVKNNAQALPSADDTTSLVDELIALLTEHRKVRNAVFPRHFGPVAFNRYRPGDDYGLHVDAAWMGRFPDARRSDLSFTLFLSDPDEYDGGELRIATGFGAPAVKLPAGQMMVYPTKYLHEVITVRSGERHAAIGWIESWIADPDLRELATKARSIDEMLNAHGVPAVIRMMMGELATELERYGSR